MEPVKTETERLVHMDLLKCLAMYFVVLFHGTLYTNLVLPDMPLSMLLRYFSRTILSTCVPLFFFVNGYLLLRRPLALKRHSVKTVRLVLVTCFWLVFLRVVLQYYYQEVQPWEELRKNLWDLKDGWNNHLWYMSALIGIYLLVPVLKAAYDGSRAAFYWFTGVMVVLVFGSDLVDLGVTLFDLLVKKEFSLYYNNLPVFKQFNPFTYLSALGLVYFCLGGVASAAEERLREIPARLRNLAACVCMAACCGMLGIIGWKFSLYSKGLWDVVWNGYDTVFTLGNVLSLYLLSLNWKRDVPLVRVISSNTLGIYFVHDLVHKVTGPAANQIEALRTLPGTMLYAALLLGLTLGICLILKKLPLVKQLV